MAILNEFMALILVSFFLVFLPKYGESHCVCPLIYQPVCASDGTTYPSSCALACATESMDNAPMMVNEGPCDGDLMNMQMSGFMDDECGCPRIYEPVCGSDGNTYNTACELLCTEGVKIQSEGRCDKDARKIRTRIPRTTPTAPPPVKEVPHCVCATDSNPVCGSDGITYANKCTLRCKKVIHIRYQGTCEEGGRIDKSTMKDCMCPKIFDPVCGVDGITYPNKCELECQGVAQMKRGECENIMGGISLTCPCTRIYEPVCASDGKTYNNECLMNCQGMGLSVVLNDVCAMMEENEKARHMTGGGDDKSQRKVDGGGKPGTEMEDIKDLPACICPLYYSPVCGQDSKGNKLTYSNSCLLKCKPGTTKVKNGSCDGDSDAVVFKLGRKLG